MNSVNLIGRITKDPELRLTINGTHFCSFDLAVRRTKEVTDFLPCVAWKDTARLICDYHKKGDFIGILGRLTSRQFKNKQGENRTIYEVAVDSISFIKSKTESKQEDDPMNDFEEVTKDELPF